MLEDLQRTTLDPWNAQPIIVSHTSIQRWLALNIARHHGICANVAFSYLANWLWAQIGKIIPIPAAYSPFTPDQLVWRCYRLLSTAKADKETVPWLISPRLRTYLDAADDTMRYELARRITIVFDHYLVYRPEWLLQWQAGHSILATDHNCDALPTILAIGEPQLQITGASTVQHEDECWQAALWRALLQDIAAETDKLFEEVTPPAYRFLDVVRTFDRDTVSRANWPGVISIFALPVIPPLHFALLRELARWIDVRLYILNPCCKRWFDIMSTTRIKAFDTTKQLDYQEVGHPLLAAWGRQTQAQLHTVHEFTESVTSSETSAYEENPHTNWLARVQNAILNLQQETNLRTLSTKHGIAVHVCHSLSRQLEVLHDQLLNWFDEIEDLQPSDVLVAVPNLIEAEPLINAVFGTAVDMRRIPYQITGLPPLQANPVAHALFDWLALSKCNVSASELVSWLRVDAIAARYGIDTTALEIIQTWLTMAGARRGLSSVEPTEQNIPVTRHTFSDALTRLFLGYALPDDGEPVEAWLPIKGPNGSEAELLGRLACFVKHIETFAYRCSIGNTPERWGTILRDILTQCFDTSEIFEDMLTSTRAAIGAMVHRMETGAAGTILPATVVRTAFAEALDDPVRGGVPCTSVTFSSLRSLRGLPYRIVCLLGMDHGVLPTLARTDEFDLIASFSKSGKYQYREDECNLFLDLLLAARDQLLIAYTGRSIHNNTSLPPATLVDELLDHLAAISTEPNATAVQIEAARNTFIINHPLQPFSTDYFKSQYGLFTYDSDRAELAKQFASPRRKTQAPFFTRPLVTEPELVVTLDDFQRFWRHPARALLRDKLGIVLSNAQKKLLDIEPFELDYADSAAFASRVLPILLDVQEDAINTLARAQRVASASPELPSGATGMVWCKREFNALRQLANRVQNALITGVERLPFSLTIEPRWPDTAGIALFGPYENTLREITQTSPLELHGSLNLLTENGQVIFSYTYPNSRDYLAAWLTHLVYCTVLPDGPRRTIWYGHGKTFEFIPAKAPLDELAALAALYRAGHILPLRFFPNSAWASVQKSKSVAQSIWVNDYGRSESDDPAWRIVLRDTPLALDATSSMLATLVFKPLVTYLRRHNIECPTLRK